MLRVVVRNCPVAEPPMASILNLQEKSRTSYLVSAVGAGRFTVSNVVAVTTVVVSPTMVAVIVFVGVYVVVSMLCGGKFLAAALEVPIHAGALLLLSQSLLSTTTQWM